MKKEVMFELEIKDFLKSKEVCLKELTKMVKFSSLGCLCESKYTYFLDVLVSSSLDSNPKNMSFLHSCVLDLCCDKETNYNRFSGVYNDIFRLLVKKYIIEKDFIHDKENGVVYKYITFCVTRHKLKS